MGGAVLDQVDRHAHRRVFFAAQCARRRLVHADGFARVLHGDARDQVAARFAQLGIDPVLQAHEDDVDVRTPLQEIERRGNGHMGAVVPPHAIDGDGYIHLMSSLARTVHGAARVNPRIDTNRAAPTRLWS